MYHVVKSMLRRMLKKTSELSSWEFVSGNSIASRDGKNARINTVHSVGNSCEAQQAGSRGSR